MFEPKTLSELLLLCVVRIEARVTGEWLPATAFLFTFRPLNRQPVLALITNKHVRDDADELRVFFHLGEQATANTAEPCGALHAATIQDVVTGWVDHPTAEVDLCAYPCQELVNQVESETGLRVFQRSLDKSVISSDEQLKELSAAEDVLMVGYPSGIWDDVNNLPLMRRGMTATHACVDFGGRPEGIVDIGAIVGSSGSPVVILSEGLHFNRKPKPGETVIKQGDRFVLLGIAADQATMGSEGEVKKRALPMRRKEMYSVTAIPIHLAYYVKAKELLTLEAMMSALGPSPPQGS